MKTVPRNHVRKIAAIKAAATVVVRYALDNDFAATPVPAEAAWTALDRFDFARLVDNEDGTYVVTVHGNLWYKLSAPVAPSA